MHTDAHQGLRDLVAERVAAVQAKNPEPLAARQAPDVITFNVLPPLHMQGKDAVLQQTQPGSTRTRAISATTSTT